jgi:anti-sigma factor RsiW
MACERHESDLREAALGEPLSVELESHLEGCPSCRADLREERALLGAIDQGLAGDLGIEPSPGFAARVRRAAEKDRARSWLPLAASVAALAAGPPPARTSGAGPMYGEPQVLVPPGQELALAHFREALRGRVIPATSLLAMDEAGQTSLEPVELGVPPLEVTALPAPEAPPEDSENTGEGRRPS